MTRFLFALVCLLGAATVAWVGIGFLGTNLVALTATLLIALVYGFGFLELRRFRADSAQLARQLDTPPGDGDALERWLAELPAALRGAVRRRVEGESTPLPGPMLTPYLSGLLVMLGLLGTFIGMIVTLQGAVSALEGGNNLAAVQSALAAPIAGLSLAFGTSIAGVAASAMLGLGATLSRRERTLVGRELDAMLRRDLRAFSLKHQQHEAFRALQSQSDAFPAVVDSLQVLTRRLEQMGDQLNSALTDNQKLFHEQTAEHYRQLAASVGDSLSTSLADSSRLAAESVRPVIAEALERLNDQAEQSHQRLNTLTESQLSQIAERFEHTTEQAARSWREGLAEHQQTAQALTDKVAAALHDHNDRFQAHGEALLTQIRDGEQQAQADNQQRLTAISERFQAASDATATGWREGLDQQQQLLARLISELGDTLRGHNDQFQQTASGLVDGQREGMETLITRSGEQLSALRDQEAARGDAATQRLADLEATAARHLTELGTALEAPMTRLIETASETPKAAAEVISRLREEMAQSSERDNELLEERRRIMTELDALLTAQQQAAGVQRDAVETLIRDAGGVLKEVSDTFAGQVDAQTARLDDAAADIAGGAHEVASLGDAFGTAVNLFSESNGKLLDNLKRIETSLEQSAARSDEQLAYYVEQAREVIDLSLSSQKEVIDALAALKNNEAP
ncbi:MAG: DUF802 domain-containing protein [Alcanivorax sp.]